VPRRAPEPLFAYALVADLASSRTQKGRPALAREVAAATAFAARRGPWLAPPVVVKGLDELSAVLKTPDCAFDVATDLNVLLWPRRFRFGFSYGAIDVAADSAKAAAMDGPAFHAAADALERARAHDLPFAVSLPGMSEGEVLLVEAVARLHGAILRERSKGAAATARELRRREGATQARVAEALGATQQAVSAALRRARVDDLAAAEAAIRSSLAAYGAARAGSP
jgi:hypothetical protein